MLLIQIRYKASKAAYLIFYFKAFAFYTNDIYNYL